MHELDALKKRKRLAKETKRETHGDYQLIQVDSDCGSPIIGLRHHASLNHQSNHVINRQLPRIRPLVKTNPALDPATYIRASRSRPNRVMSVRRSITDLHAVIDIDRWSRLCFPILFLLFNVSYWLFYIVRPQTLT